MPYTSFRIRGVGVDPETGLARLLVSIKALGELGSWVEGWHANGLIPPEIHTSFPSWARNLLPSDPGVRPDRGQLRDFRAAIVDRMHSLRLETRKAREALGRPWPIDLDSIFEEGLDRTEGTCDAE